MSWVSPTGHDDPDNAWDAETNVYDDDENTTTGSSPVSGTYSKFLHVTHVAITSDRLRFMAYSDGTVDIDVKLNSVWTDVFEGVTIHHTWMEKTFVEGSVDEIRFRLKRVGPTVAMYEVDFYEVTPSPPSGSGFSFPPYHPLFSIMINHWLNRRRIIKKRGMLAKDWYVKELAKRKASDLT